MLTKDGALLNCGDYHPYANLLNGQPIKGSNKRVTSSVLIRKKDLLWFMSNSAHKETRDLAEKCFEIVKDKQDRRGRHRSSKSNDAVILKKEREIEPFLLLEELTNEEFCKVRTSNAKFPRGGENGEVYFRITSTDFNWFDVIWNVVANDEHFCKSITIVRDISIGAHQEEYYTLNGKKTFQMPREEFLTLPGNPVVK